MHYGLSELRNAVKEVQAGLHWYVVFDASIGSDTTPIVEYDSALAMRVQSCGIPKEQANNIKVELGGHIINYIGKTERSSSIQITLVEDSDQAKVTKLLRSYCDARWTNAKGVQTLTATTKTNITIYACDLLDRQVKAYRLDGCLFTFSTNLNLDQAANAEIITMDVTYDNFEILLMK